MNLTALRAFLADLLTAFGDFLNPDRIGPAAWARDTDSEEETNA